MDKQRQKNREMSYSKSILQLSLKNLYSEIKRLEEENKQYLERLSCNKRQIEDLVLKIDNINQSIFIIETEEHNGQTTSKESRSK